MQMGGRHRTISGPLLKALLISNPHVNFWVAHAIPPPTVYLFSFVLRLILPLFVCMYIYICLYAYIFVYTYMLIHTTFSETPLLPH